MHRRLLILAGAVVAVVVAAQSFAQAPKLKPGTYAHFDTSMGKFTVRLMPERSPQTVANFVGLAEGTIDTITGRPGKSKPFYNGSTFHRVIAGFMIQGGGIQRGDGVVGVGYTIPDEFDPKFKFSRAGILAMANTSQPHSAGSQFFITVAPYPSLNGKYTPFGEVVSGLAVVTKISTVKTTGRTGTPANRPLQPVVIKTVTIERVGVGK
jgi:peptidyl-prolyl cis-trans isomerase A (cyclophilin A)